MHDAPRSGLAGMHRMLPLRVSWMRCLRMSSMRHAALMSVALVFPAAPCTPSEPAAVEMDEAFAVYGPGIFPAITRMEVCGAFRAMVVYWAGTDMLFVDEVAPALNESTMAVRRGLSIREFNHYEDSNTIKSLSCRISRGNLRVSGKAADGHSSGTYAFQIVLDTASWKYTYSDTRK